VKIITLSPNQYDTAVNAAKEWFYSAKWKQQKYQLQHLITGALGEYAFSLYSGMPFNSSGAVRSGDNQIDFPDGTDVKTATWKDIRSVELKVSRPPRLNIPVKPTRYVCAHMYLNDNVVRLIGEISVERYWQIKKEKEFVKNGKKIIYSYVSISDLEKHYE